MFEEDENIQYFEKIDNSALLKELKSHLIRSPKNQFDEFDEVAVPWQTGYTFNENSPIEWVRLLKKLAESKEYVVFGKTSNVNGEWDHYPNWQEQLSIIWKVDDDHYEKSIYCKNKKLEETFKYGFYPSYVRLMGSLPRCLIWKCFKRR